MIKMATIRAASGLICSATSIGSTPTPPSDSATPKSYRPVKPRAVLNLGVSVGRCAKAHTPVRR
jgi:hypothetical protein